MSIRGADWYKREPRAFLEGVRKLSEREVAVYAIVLDLIYDGGHQTLNDPKHIASYFSDLGTAGVRRAIDRLVAAGKLIIDGDFLTNKRAQNEGKTREELTENRRKVGRLGGVSSAKSRSKSREINTLAEPIAPYAGAIDKIREDIEKKEEAKASSKKRGSCLGDDWVLPEAWAEWAVGEGLSRSEVQRQAERFKDYWIAVPGQKGVKGNWNATWRNWVRKSVDDRKPAATGDDEYRFIFGRM